MTTAKANMRVIFECNFEFNEVSTRERVITQSSQSCTANLVFSLETMSNQSENAGDQQNEDAAPAKRVRKQTDKDFSYSGQQLASAPKKPIKPTAASKERQRAQQALKAALPIPVNVNVCILPSVALSSYDKASQLTLSKDQLLCHGCEVRVS